MKLEPAKPVFRKKGYWLIYSLPMIVVWGIFLLTFWPGMMSYDFITEWDQVVKGVFSDAIPIFHTLFVWFLTRIWFSPSIVIIFQIISLALAVAWGIRILDDRGLPGWAGWVISLAFAFVPLNWNMVLILQKDTMYSVCLFALSLIFLKIIFSNGTCLTSRVILILLTVCSLGVSSFRHNGPPIAFTSLLILIAIYRKYWRQIISSFAVFLFLYLFIHGPLIPLLKVDPVNLFKNQIWLHHIAAHYSTGDKFTAAEEASYKRIFGDTVLQYSCCNILTTTRSLESVSHEDEIVPLFASLAVREPSLEFQHQACASSIIWEIPSRCELLNDEPTAAGDWISKYIPYFIENSLIPFLSTPLIELFIKSEGIL